MENLSSDYIENDKTSMLIIYDNHLLIQISD